MNWDTFWSAFGAIGTSLGSLITAIAVVVAVVQYRQPLRKRIKLTLSTAIPISDFGPGEWFHCITVANTGVRNITVTNVYLGTRKKKLMINNLMRDLDPNHRGSEFPQELLPEGSFSVYLHYAEIGEAFHDLLSRKTIRAHQRLNIWVTDTTGGNHILKTKLTPRWIILNQENL